MPHPTTPPQDQPLPSKPKLFVNDGPLETYGYLRPSHPSEPLSELRARYEQDGYVWLKNLLPRSDVLKARREYFNYLSPSGVLAPNTTPEQGIFDATKSPAGFPGIGAGAVGGNGKPGGEAAAMFVDRALEAHSLSWYKDDFCKHPDLLGFVKRFTGWGEHMIPIQRTLLRNNIPGTHAIGVHYDQIFLRHGEATAVTAWVPIGDVKADGGGLIYLENGHTVGREQEEEFTRNAMQGGMTEEEAKSAFNANMMATGLLGDEPKEYGERFGRKWLVADYEAGDVVLHTPFTIHAGTINHDKEHVIRLATDLRFVDGSKPWDKRWDKLYEVGDGV